MKFLAGLFIFFTTAVQPQSIHELFGTDKFHRAYAEANTNEITFEPFQELNWEAKACTALPWLNLDRPLLGKSHAFRHSTAQAPSFVPSTSAQVSIPASATSRTS